MIFFKMELKSVVDLPSNIQLKFVCKTNGMIKGIDKTDILHGDFCFLFSLIIPLIYVLVLCVFF